MSEFLIPENSEALQEVRTLFREYASALGIDLTFQHFEEELAALPGEYATPRGVLLLVRHEGRLAGCGALRPLKNEAHPCAAEMKRLYVRPDFRGLGLGRALAEELLRRAGQAGYRSILLDTLPSMQSARALYQHLGFRPMTAYYPNPIPGTVYLKYDMPR